MKSVDFSNFIKNDDNNNINNDNLKYIEDSGSPYNKRRQISQVFEKILLELLQKITYKF